MTRLSTSRPISSVPNGCAADGPCRMFRASIAKGSYGARTSAPRAASSSSARIGALISRRAFRAAQEFSGIAQLRIEQAEHKVDRQADQHEQHEDRQQRALDQRIVAVVAGAHEQR